jgi:hypothetical protein
MVNDKFMTEFGIEKNPDLLKNESLIKQTNYIENITSVLKNIQCPLSNQIGSFLDSKK